MAKRLLSIVLTTVIILSAFTSFPVYVNAEEDAETTNRLIFNINCETYEKDARYVPNYVITGTDTIQPMYNPYTAKMLLDMSNWAYSLNDNDTAWKNEVANNYGYTQFYHIVNDGVNGPYLLGETSEMVDDKEVTTPHYMSAVNAIVSLKEVVFNGKKKYAVAVAFKGTNFLDVADVWADLRFVANSDGVHKGFAGTATDFYTSCRECYFTIDGNMVSLYDMIQDMKNDNSDYCMLVTGHSLGGALANTFVGYNLYNDGVKPQNVLAYTYASPRPFSQSYKYPYKNIINIINNDDFVPTAPSIYKRVGTDFAVDFNNTVRAGVYIDKHQSPAYIAGIEGDLGSNYWNTLAVQAVLGFDAHIPIEIPYQACLSYIDSNTDSFTKYHTNGDSAWPSVVTIDNSCYKYINGDLKTPYGSSGIEIKDGELIVNGKIETDYIACQGNAIIYPEDSIFCYAFTVNDGNTLINGNLNGGLKLTINGGSLTVTGDAEAQTWECNENTVFQSGGNTTCINLNVKNAYMEIGQDLTAGYISLDCGTVTVKGSIYKNVYRIVSEGNTSLNYTGQMSCSYANINSGNTSISGDISVSYLTLDSGNLTLSGEFLNTIYSINCEGDTSLVSSESNHCSYFSAVNGNTVVSKGLITDYGLSKH